jgi:hypothetical protein
MRGKMTGESEAEMTGETIDEMTGEFHWGDWMEKGEGWLLH